VKLNWIHRNINAPADRVWDLLTDTNAWPTWGPSVRSATVHGGHLTDGATGTIKTVFGPELSFEITEFELGSQWSWKVAGVTATNHTVQPLDAETCRAGFGVPIVATPYLAVCRWALIRLQRLAEVDS